MLDQRRRRWADVVQMVYKCFVFAGYVRTFSVCEISDLGVVSSQPIIDSQICYYSDNVTSA